MRRPVSDSAFDPQRSLDGSKSRSAAGSCHIGVCYPCGRKHRRHCAVKRREFITLLGGVAAWWPPAVRAQQAGKVRRIGYLGFGPASIYTTRVEALRAGLRELGYVEGQNIVIE